MRISARMSPRMSSRPTRWSGYINPLHPRSIVINQPTNFHLLFFLLSTRPIPLPLRETSRIQPLTMMFTTVPTAIAAFVLCSVAVLCSAAVEPRASDRRCYDEIMIIEPKANITCNRFTIANTCSTKESYLQPGAGIWVLNHVWKNEGADAVGCFKAIQI
ncbi:MAG: hypothetical protein J3Q66DRAFT_345417 [Benniella sp.]|nr:MAG: hypothetical protein J3Q66DRAFT_345417 [Benniella sp.]